MMRLSVQVDLDIHLSSRYEHTPTMGAVQDAILIGATTELKKIGVLVGAPGQPHNTIQVSTRLESST